MNIPPDRLRALETGQVQTRTLTEGLAIDFAALLRAAFPEDAHRAQDLFPPGMPLLRRMERAGDFLANHPEHDAVFAHAIGHFADTVRGWAAYALRIKWEDHRNLEKTLRAIRPLADDSHFGVREWAWLALRPAVLEETARAIALLTPWTDHPSENIRRFAVEILRPRGVWCAHSPELKANPAPGLSLIEPLRADPSLYVRKSVGNWLNDASKTHPEWVDSLCARWEAESPTPETRHIARRARRSLPKT